MPLRAAQPYHSLANFPVLVADPESGRITKGLRLRSGRNALTVTGNETLLES